LKEALKVSNGGTTAIVIVNNGNSSGFIGSVPLTWLTCTGTVAEKY